MNLIALKKLAAKKLIGQMYKHVATGLTVGERNKLTNDVTAELLRYSEVLRGHGLRERGAYGDALIAIARCSKHWALEIGTIGYGPGNTGTRREVPIPRAPEK